MMINIFTKCIMMVSAATILAGCSDNGIYIEKMNVGEHNNNELIIQIDLVTSRPADVYAEYWKADGRDTGKFRSTVSHHAEKHSLILCNIIGQTNYDYRIIIEKNGVKRIGETYTFKSNPLPEFLQASFKADSAPSARIPAAFSDGLMLINKRATPGIAYLVDKKGTIRWYHMINGLGFKVINYTKDQTILSILGSDTDTTSYGHEILELNMFGDTVLHLKQGQNDFKQIIHHDIIKNDKGQLVTLYVDKRIRDLSSVGGGKKDTVSGDGIIVLDKTGKKIWSWSVFDALDPLKDKNILKTKNDWMHANCVTFDKDGNYLISFYNNGQIWKIDARTGSVIWKFGKGGTIAMPSECDFTQAHAVHINQQGNLMFFDNGVEKQQSSVFAVKLNQQNRTSQIDMHIRLPKIVFNDRMGSAYLINDTSVLVCCSKRHLVVLTNGKGNFLWTMETTMPSYRAEFIRSDALAPYLKP